MDILTLIPIPIHRIKSIFKKRKTILQKEGFVSLLKNLFTTFRDLLFSYQRLYLYRYRLDTSADIPDVSCKVDNLVIKPIFVPISLQEYELLGNEGFDFFKHPEAREYKEGLGDGTIVFCAFTDNELVFRTCLTLYRDGVYRYIYPAYLDKGATVYSGFSETKKEYRLKGVYKYVWTEIYRYLRKKKGVEEVILLEPADQVGPRKVQDRFGAKVLCKSYFLRLLFLLTFRWNRPNILKKPKAR
jgi:hypothetical protein